MQRAIRRRLRQRPLATFLSHRDILTYIAERADVLDVTTRGRGTDDPSQPATQWLLVPVTDLVLANLELYDAETADLEDDEREPDADAERTHPDNRDQSELVEATFQGRAHLGDEGDDDEDSGDREPNIGAASMMLRPDKSAGELMTVAEWRRR